MTPSDRSAFPGRTVPLSLRARALPFPATAPENRRLIASRLLKQRDPPPPPEIRCARDRLLRVFHHDAWRRPANLFPSLPELSSAHLPGLDRGNFRSDAKTDVHWRQVRPAFVAKDSPQNASRCPCRG